MRFPRFYYSSNFYHVIGQGDEKKFIFDNDDCKRKMIYLLKSNAKRNKIKLISYCIMSNHYHALVYAPVIEDLSKMMSQTNTAFGKYYSKLRKNVGHVFRDRFKSESIYTKNHMVNCIKYIHENPVRANMCELPSDYHYSSYYEFMKLNGETKKICGLCEDDIKDILEETHTITEFLDDEYSKEDIEEAFRTICKEVEDVKDTVQRTGMIYARMKTNCRVSDKVVAELLRIDRGTMLRRLKAVGLKK